ncbi:MAG: PAS domain S-box protein [Sphingobacteriaceae bacterium]
MERKINQEHLAFQKLIEHSSSGITLRDAQFNVLYRSPSAKRINGWDDGVPTEKAVDIFVHPQEHDMVISLMRRVSQAPGTTEAATFRSKHYDGHYIWLQCSFTNMLEEPNIRAIVCNFIDVSEQKRIEIELTSRTNQITELLETMTDSFIALDENLCYTYANRQALKLARKSREELIGKHIWDVFPEVVGSATFQAIQTAFTEKKYVYNQDFYAPHQLWQENRIYPSAGGISIFIRDITRQKKEEHHLKLLESVITNTTDAVLITEAEPFDFPDQRILYVNEAFTIMTGYTAEEVIGKTPRILQGPKTDKEELLRLGACLRKWNLCEATLINYKKNGEEFWVNLSLNPVADENGWFTHWVSIERDVTQRKNEDLQKSLLVETSQLFNEPMELGPLLDKLLEKVVAYDHFLITEIWLTGADKNKINLTAKTAGSPKMIIFYQETSQLESFTKGQSLPGVVWESGKIVEWDLLEDRAHFLRSNAAKNAGIKSAYGIPLISESVTIGVLVIGSGKKRSEESRFLIPLFESLSTHFGVEIKRKQLEKELHQIFSLAPDIICVIGLDSYFKKVNPAMSTLLGYTEMELLAQPIDAFLHPDEVLSNNQRMEKFTAGEKNLFFEVRFLTKANETIWLSWAVHLNAGEGLLFSVAKDITGKKQAEQMLCTSESNLNAVFENTDAFIYSLDRNLRYVTFNTKLYKMMWEIYQVYVYPGYPVLDFISNHHPDEVQEWQNIYNKAFAGEVVQFEKDYVIKGYQTYSSFSIHPIYQDEEITGLSCFVNDITDRKHTILLLKESEKSYSELFQLSPLPKLVFDLETLRILDFNNAAMSQYGFTREEFLQMSIDQFRPPEEIPISDRLLKELKKSTGATAQHDIIHQKKNGEKIRVDFQSNPTLYKGKNARIAIARDITENLNYIHAIEAQNEKLKEISWMQSHIIRAPLARIMGLVPLISDLDEIPAETREMMDYLMQSANELDEVIREITLKTELIDPKAI